MANKGRGPDSMLVHMAPQEVAGLQALAMKHGGTLTINPETGLPEAGFLSKILPMLAGAALNYFAPGFGTAISGALGLGEVAGAGAIGTGIGVGGVTTLATGSLSRGLMAGLGAYGGAGLTEGLMGAGNAALGQQAVSSTASELMNAGAGEQLTGEAYNQAMQEGVKNRLTDLAPQTVASAGVDAAKAAPGTFLKNNWMPTAAAALPVLSAIGTTTAMPAKPVDTGYIRQKLYDPYTQTYKTLAPVKASEYGNRSFSDAYTNPQTGEVSTLQPRAPYNMATGGIVALADGGDAASAGAAYAAANNIDLNQNINNWIASNPNADRATIDATMGKYGISQDDVNRALSASTVTSPAVDYALSHGQGLADLNKEIAGYTNAAGTKNATDAQIDAQMQQYGISNEDVARALKATGGSQGEQYAVLAGNMGLSGLNTNINQWLAANPGATLADAQAAMNKVNINEADVRRATGKSLAELYPTKTITPITPIPGSGVVPGGTQMPGATVYGNGAYGNYGSGPATGVDYLGRTVSIATPGDIITNPDNTRTVVPNIPGRPYGGFTGMDQVKSAYTAGGGSLGYTPQAPKNMAEFNQMYNKQTGDSMAAYNYLMGQGAYPTQSVAANSATGIQRPYFSAGMKYKPKFLTQNADGTISSSTTSGGSASNLLAAKTINVRNEDGTVAIATLGNDGAYHTSDGASYNVTGQKVTPPTAIAESSSGTGGQAAGGLQGYARGGVLHPFFSKTTGKFTSPTPQVYADGGYAVGGGLGSLGSYSDGGRLLKGPGDGVSDSIPATIGAKNQPARLADGEFVVPARIVSELGNGSTEAGAKKLYAMMDRVQKARGKTTGKNKVAANSRSDKYLPA
jgi:hypothetical protein